MQSQDDSQILKSPNTQSGSQCAGLRASDNYSRQQSKRVFKLSIEGEQAGYFVQGELSDLRPTGSNPSNGQQTTHGANPRLCLPGDLPSANQGSRKLANPSGKQAYQSRSGFGPQSLGPKENQISQPQPRQQDFRTREGPCD